MKHAEYKKIFDNISDLTEGNALVCTDEGQILVSGGKELEFLPAPAFACLKDCLANRQAIATSRDEDFVVTVVHIATNKWLVLDNQGKIDYEKRQKQAIVDALPFIAQIAGGDATLFNVDGIRENAFFPDGSENAAAIGEYRDLYANTLREMRPSMGPAFFVRGASAVRIPITRKFGLAFNNQQSTSRQHRLLQESRKHKSAYYQFEDILGISGSIKQAKKIAQTAAKTNSTVLIYGETGTGKELFAQAIHNAGERAMHPFVAINCGAIPENLVESILFGYAEGAFTGAKKSGNVGAFEQANNGTLFLDEISEMPLDLQVRLLRAIQEREITRIGDATPIKVDVRIIAATNLNIKEMVETGTFRADLYFRLNVLTVQIPSLRERMEDIPYLLDNFLHKFAQLMSKSGYYLELSPEVLKVLKKYQWPGNVRELQNCAEHAVNMLEAGDSSIDLRHLPYYIVESSDETNALTGNSSFEDYMYQREHEFLLKAFKESEGNKSHMARKLGVNRTTLLRLLKKHDIK